MLDKISVPVELDEVLCQLFNHYGLTGALVPLTGERDHNFVFSCADGTKLVVKIAHEDETYDTLDFQSQVIERIQKLAPHVPVSAEISNRDGETITRVTLRDGRNRYMRVNAFVDGVPLSDVGRTFNTRQATGRLAAEIAVALRGFQHASFNRVLLWDLEQAVELAPHVQALSREHQDLVGPFFNRFVNHGLPASAVLPQGFIHNDMNLHNLFVDPTDDRILAGCIDFGDMVWAPLVNDLAVATAYQLDFALPLQSIAEFASAYHAVRPLNALEVDQLFDRVAMRMVLTVAITHWRSQLHPENKPYIMRNAPAASAGLEAMGNISPETAREFFHDRLQLKTGKLP